LGGLGVDKERILAATPGPLDPAWKTKKDIKKSKGLEHREFRRDRVQNHIQYDEGLPP
jgi:hypothetical protein